MIRNLKSLVMLLAGTLFMLASCSKEDISGKLDGVWKTEWDDSLEGDLDDIRVQEVLVLQSTDSYGNHGEFMQIFSGEVEFDDWSNESTVGFQVTIPGKWEVVDKNKLRFLYDLQGMSTSIGKSNVTGDYTDVADAIGMLSGDLNALARGMTRANDIKKINSKIETEVDRQVNKFFRDMFREINKDKKAMTNVKIDGDIMTCDVNHGFFGREQNYDRISSDPGNMGMANAYQGNASLAGGSLPQGGSISQFSWLSQNELSSSQLRQYSKAELRILRNAIFAMYGYKFKSADLQQYFGQFYDYNPVTSQTPHFNSIEKKNIEIIKRYE